MNDAAETQEAAEPPSRGFGAPSAAKPIEKGVRGAALVIANWDYPVRRLSGPKRDLDLVTKGFEANRFHVTSAANVRRPEHLIDRVSRFVDRILVSREPQQGGFAGPVFVYFAGHGAKSPKDGRDYILPSNVDDETFLRDPHSAVSLDDIVAELHRLKDAGVALVLDACRDMPASRGMSQAVLPAFGGVSPKRAEEMRGQSGGPAWLGLYFSTQPGRVAADSMAGPGSESPFAHAFSRCLGRLPWQVRARGVDEFFSRDVQKAFRSLQKRVGSVGSGEGSEEQSIAVTQSGLVAPAIGAHIGRQLARAIGVIMLAVAIGLAWRLFTFAPSAPSRPPEVVQAPLPIVPAEPNLPEPAPSEPPAPSGEADRLRGRVWLTTAAAEMKDKGNMAIVAGLALRALDLPGFSAHAGLRAEAAQLLYRAQLDIRKPQAEFPIPGVPPGMGNKFHAESAFSRDGSLFAIQAATNAFRVFDTSNGSLIGSVDPQGVLERVDFTSDGNALLLFAADRVTILRVRGGPVEHWSIPLLGRTKKSGWPVFNRDGSRMMDTGDPKRIVIRDGRSGDELRSIPTHSQAIAEAFSADGAYVAATLENGRIGVWESESKKPVLMKTLRPDARPSGYFSRDGRYLLVTDSKTWDLSLLEVKTGRELKPRSKPRPQAFNVSQFLNADNDILTLQHDGTVIVWNPVTDRELSRFAAGEEPMNLQPSDDGETILVTTNKYARLVAWRWRSREKLFDRLITWHALLGMSLDKEGNAVHFVDDGKLKTLPLFPTGGVTRLAGIDDETNHFVLSPDSRRLATASSERTRLWDTTSSRMIREIVNRPQDGPNNASALAFSRDNRLLSVGPASEGGGPIRVLRADNGTDLGALSGEVKHRSSVHLVPSKILSPVLYSIGYSTFIMWDLSDGTQLRWYGIDTRGRHTIFEQEQADEKFNVFAIAYNPLNDGLSVIDVINGTKPKDRKWMLGHSAYVLDSRFGHTGQQVFSASQDKTVRVWDVASHAELRQVRFPEGVKEVAVSADDEEVYILTGDAALHRWRWRTDDMIRGKPLPDCAGGQLEGTLLLCRKDSGIASESAILRAVGPRSDLDVLASFAGEVELIDDGRYVLERDKEKKTVVLYPTFPSLEAMKEAVRPRLEPYREAIAAAEEQLR